MTSVAPSPHHKALLLGVSDYQHYGKLIGPRKDVLEMRRVLVDPFFGLFAPSHVRQLVNLHHELAFDEIESFFAASKQTDHLLFYFSGHGALDDSDRLHLCFVNTRPRRWEVNSLSWASISRMIDSARAASITTILDCCYSGQSKGGAILPLGAFKATGRCKLASCLETERSKDAARAGDTSPFTDLVVRAFETPGPRSRDKGYISPADVAKFIDDNRGARLPHTPMSETKGVGEIALALAPASETALASPQEDVEPPPLSPTLQSFVHEMSHAPGTEREAELLRSITRARHDTRAEARSQVRRAVRVLVVMSAALGGTLGWICSDPPPASLLMGCAIAAMILSTSPFLCVIPYFEARQCAREANNVSLRARARGVFEALTEQAGVIRCTELGHRLAEILEEAARHHERQ